MLRVLENGGSEVNLYLLLLRGHPYDQRTVSPAEIQRILDDYGAWRSSLEEQGRLVGSNKLTDEGGRLLDRRGDEVRVTDGPFAESKEVISGYFLVRAADYDDAIELSERCPHLKYGGTIAVRQVDTMYHD